MEANNQSAEAGFDAALRTWLTPVVILLAIGLALSTVTSFTADEKPGSVTSALVLLLSAVMSAKLAAESYIFSYIGGDPSERQSIAVALSTACSGVTKLRYFFGALGGIVFPLGVQILLAGSKEIPPVSDPRPPAILAFLALICVVPGEILQRKAWGRATELAGS